MRAARRILYRIRDTVAGVLTFCLTMLLNALQVCSIDPDAGLQDHVPNADPLPVPSPERLPTITLDSAPVEVLASSSGRRVSATFSLPYEHLQRVSKTFSVPYEHVRRVSASNTKHGEHLRTVASTG